MANKVYGAVIVDVFCGSGAVGIEGLSRGARSCTFIENNRAALQALKRNLADLKSRAAKQDVAVETRVMAVDARSAVAGLSENQYDIIWLDPPYELLATCFPKLWPDLYKALSPEGVCIVESDIIGAKALLAHLQKLGQEDLLAKQKNYGKTVVSFIQKS